MLSRRKNFEDIKTEIEHSLSSSLGSVNLVAPSVLWTIVAIFADRENQLWEQAEAVYNSMYPQTAEGYSLVGICALNGIVRSKATSSVVVCQLTAVLYTNIPKGSMVMQNSQQLFALEEDITITNDKCSAVKILIQNNSYSSYGVIINKKLLEVSNNSKTTKEIAAGLSAIINQANVDIVANYNEDSISLVTKNTEFSCTVTDGIKLAECTNNAKFKACLKGAIAAPSNSLNIIHTPISGWLACNNLTGAIIGNNLESDFNLRQRREQSIKLGGSGSLEAIRANLLNLTSVTAVSITENNSSGVKLGLPPHSFEVLITGGDDSDIAKAIWYKKPAGIKSHGTIDVSIKDSQDNTQVISFSRPTKRFVYGKITITKTKDFIPATAEVIKKGIVNQINNLGVGFDVILKSLFVSVFSQKAIAGASILLGSSSNEDSKPTMRESDIAIKNNEVALTDLAKIEIIFEDF